MRARQQRRRRLRHRADLLQRGVSVSVFLIGRVAEVRGDARINLEILGRLGLTVVEVADSQAWELHFSEVSDCTLIVDAIFGTGLNAPIAGFIESVITDVNASGIPVVAIDLPTGLSADSPEPIGPSIEAGLTVTLAAPKLPLVLPPGEAPRRRHRHRRHRHPERSARSGRRPARRSVDPRVDARADHAADARQPQGRLRTRARRRRLARARPARHISSAVGALRSGAGLVTVATPASCQAVVAAMGPEYMTEALAETGDGLDPKASIG